MLTIWWDALLIYIKIITFATLTLVFVIIVTKIFYVGWEIHKMYKCRNLNKEISSYIK